MIKHKTQQLFDILADELRRGTWLAGQKLPTLRDIAVQYDVSINVATQAVTLLKEAGLVKTKTGDGIYSLISEPVVTDTVKYAGERLFGHYFGAKILRVAVEDYEDWQLDFWNPFFQAFALNNPDIELQVSYGLKDDPALEFDCGLGAPVYLSRRGLSPENLYPASVYRDFYPELYRDLPLTPEMLSWKGIFPYLPYGFLSMWLLGPDDAAEPEVGEPLLDYIERMAADSGRPLPYRIFSGMDFLHAAELNFFVPDSGILQLPPREEMLAVFHRCRELWRRGGLLWEHGAINDYDQLFRFNGSDAPQLIEIYWNRLHRYPAARLAAEGMKLFPRLSGKRFSVLPMAMGIHRRCRFPEEALRLLRALLEPERQTLMHRAKIVQSLRPEALQSRQTASPPLFSGVYEIMPFVMPEMALLEHYYHFVNWEFFYFINGQRDDRVYEILTRKLRYGMASPEF